MWGSLKRSILRKVAILFSQTQAGIVWLLQLSSLVQSSDPFICCKHHLLWLLATIYTKLGQVTPIINTKCVTKIHSQIYFLHIGWNSKQWFFLLLQHKTNNLGLMVRMVKFWDSASPISRPASLSLCTRGQKRIGPNLWPETCRWTHLFSCLPSC